MQDNDKKFGIIAQRSGMSAFGAAMAWCKKDGEIMLFDTLEDARTKAIEYSKNISSGNVHYTVSEYDKYDWI